MTIAADRRMTGTHLLRGSRARITRLVACALVAGVLACAPAQAQQSQLDPVLITAITLDSAQQQQVRAGQRELQRRLPGMEQRPRYWSSRAPGHLPA